MRGRRPLVVVTGGGSGGHIYPALAVAAELTPGFEVAYVGARSGMEAQVVPRGDLAFFGIRAGGIAGKHVVGKARGLALTAMGFLEALRLLGRLRPRAVLGTGGYVAGPVGLAAALLGIPLAILELDARLGVTNRLLGRFAAALFLGFPASLDGLPSLLRAKAIGTGIPVRAEIGRVGREEAAASFDLDAARPIVLAFGGSLGSLPLNEAVDGILRAGGPPGFQLIWGTGRRYADRYDGDGRKDVRCLPYIEDLPTAIAAADVVVARAGAMTVAELSAAGKPAILVPSPYVSDDQQFRNAALAETAGGAIVLTDADLEAGRLAPVLKGLLATPERLREMGAKMRQVIPEGAAKAIARRMRYLAARREDAS